MKTFIVDTGKKKYIVEANDAEHAVEIVKRIDDEDDIALSLEKSLKTLSSKYTVGKIYDYIRTHAVYGVPNNPDAINRVKEVLSKNGATKFKVVKNDYGFAIVCFKAKDSINGTVTEKNLEDSILSVINDSIKGSLDDLIVQAKTPKGIDLRSISLNLADDLIDKAKRDGYDVVITYYDKYARRTKTAKLSESDVANLKYVLRNDSVMRLFIVDSNSALVDSMINDNIEECYKSLAEAKDIISTIYKNHAKEQDEEYMLKKLKEASSAIARAIRQYKAWI